MANTKFQIEGDHKKEMIACGVINTMTMTELVSKQDYHDRTQQVWLSVSQIFIWVQEINQYDANEQKISTVGPTQFPQYLRYKVKVLVIELNDAVKIWKRGTTCFNVFKSQMHVMIKHLFLFTDAFYPKRVGVGYMTMTKNREKIWGNL